MKIKTKISLGLSLLFSMILIVAVLGIYNLHSISNSMQGLISDNFQSVGYAKNMLQALDEVRNINDVESVPLNESSLVDFEKNLVNQENNITEIGEKEVTEHIRTYFEQLKKAIVQQNNSVETRHVLSLLKTLLYDIIDINSRSMQAKKNEAAQKAKNGIYLVSMVATFCFLCAFSFVINFPGYIANPIRDLTAGIKQIANRNYDERLHFNSNDEFGELSVAFNTMAKRLYEYQNSTLAKLFAEKRRWEAIFEDMKIPTLGIDERGIIFIANQQISHILGMAKAELVGFNASDLALRNDLLRTILIYASTTPLTIFFEGKNQYFNISSVNVKVEEQLNCKVFFLQNVTPYKENQLKTHNWLTSLYHRLVEDSKEVDKGVDFKHLPNEVVAAEIKAFTSLEN